MLEPKTEAQSLILQKILAERSRQDEKFGAIPRNNKPELWLTVLTEETGEVARAILEGDSPNYAAELIQVAAVAIAALEDYYSGASCWEMTDVCKPIKYFQE